MKKPNTPLNMYAVTLLQAFSSRVLPFKFHSAVDQRIILEHYGEEAVHHRWGKSPMPREALKHAFVMTAMASSDFLFHSFEDYHQAYMNGSPPPPKSRCILLNLYADQHGLIAHGEDFFHYCVASNVALIPTLHEPLVQISISEEKL